MVWLPLTVTQATAVPTVIVLARYARMPRRRLSFSLRGLWERDGGVCQYTGKRLQPGERYVVDTGHLVAWEGTTQYTLRKAAAGFFRSMMSGEGIVAEFTGPGELLIQTRNLQAFASLLKPFFPSQSGGSGSGFNINLGG